MWLLSDLDVPSGAKSQAILSHLRERMARLQVLSAPGGAGANTMELWIGKNYKGYPTAGEGVEYLGGREGYIDMYAENGVGAAVHDIFHFAGALTDAEGLGVGKAGRVRIFVDTLKAISWQIGEVPVCARWTRMRSGEMTRLRGSNWDPFKVFSGLTEGSIRCALRRM